MDGTIPCVWSWLCKGRKLELNVRHFHAFILSLLLTADMISCLTFLPSFPSPQ